MNFIFEVFPNIRAYSKNILETNSLEDLNKIPKGFNNNIIWNIGHVLVTEQLLVYKLSGLNTVVSEALINKYRKGTKPETQATQKDVEEIKDLLFKTIEKTHQDYLNGVFENYNEYTVSTTGNTLKSVDDALQFALFHEGLHIGSIMALLKAIKK